MKEIYKEDADKLVKERGFIIDYYGREPVVYLGGRFMPTEIYAIKCGKRNYLKKPKRKVA